MNFWLDLKYAGRILKKSWGYSVMCAAVVALSLGLAVFVWALIYAQLIRQPPFNGSEHWYSVQIGANAMATAWPSVDAYTYQEMLKYNRSADYMGAFSDRPVVLSEGQASTRLRAMDITPRFLAATQIPTLLGRKLEATDGQPGAAQVAVLSYYTWHNYFADDPAIIGKTARIDSNPVQIVGVLPKEFMLFEDSELWMPLHLPNIVQPRDSKRWVTPFIWVDDVRKLPAILDEMNTAVKKVNSEYPNLFNQAPVRWLVRGQRRTTRPRPEAVLIDTTPLEMPLAELGPVELQLVRRTADEPLFQSLMEQYHYLRYEQPVGEHLKYLVWAQGRPVACLAWSSAPRHLASRDQFIGWRGEARRRNIRLLAYNTRFLILPWVAVPHLASHILGRMARRISQDWERIYGHPIYFLETFIDPERFRGTCYRAANWLVLGRTTGRGKNDDTHRPNRSLKEVLGLPLHRRFRELLQEDK